MTRTHNQYADLDPSGYDYLLIAISAVLTAYSAGAAVANVTVGWIFVVLSLLGVWVSFTVMRAIQGTKVVKANGFIYTVGIFAAFFASRSLVELLPDNPFKAQIFVCGLLLWMLVFGSFLIWSDQTLLFQAVPSIAIFGLVGCYDTYRGATWLFFGFLLCFATLLARVHSRTMLRQAKESGYSQSGDRMDRSATELERMRSGPWKWAAGPQWALGSAFVVILFSFVSAPIVRNSVQGVAGAVMVQAPLPNRASPIGGSNAESGGMRVGQGPNELSDLPVFRASLDQPRYMRTSIYQGYSASGWQATAAQAVGDETNAVLSGSADRRAITSIRKKQEIDFAIEPITSRMIGLPLPGEVISISPRDSTSIRMDATMTILDTSKANVFRGKAMVSDSRETPTDAVKDMPAGMEALSSTNNISPAVFELANRVANSGKTDYERVVLVKQEIERRVKYNLRAAAIPVGKDPVETFLFDTKEGYCDLFASAMAVMARAVGVPARLVVGYYPISGDQDDDGRYVIKESERHAWAELFFEGHGWVVFDATEGAEAVPGSERGTANVSPLQSSGALKLALEVLIGIAAVAFIVMMARSFYLGLKSVPSRSELDKAYLSFADVLAKASGKVRNFDQTPAEYVRESIAFLNGQAENAKTLNARFERHFYSPITPTREDLQEIRSEIAKLKAGLKGERKVA